MKHRKITQFSYHREIVVNDPKRGGRVKEKRKFFRPVQMTAGGSRLVHLIVDSMIIGVIQNVLLSVGFYNFLSTGPQVDARLQLGLLSINFGPFLFITYFFGVIYYILFEYFLQRTPGKMITSSYVINDYAEKPDIGTIVVRNLIRLVPFEAFSCLSYRGWHDKWSNTWVVPRKELNKLHELYEKEEV